MPSSGVLHSVAMWPLQAATFAPQSIERMLHVAAFAVSGYAGTNNRTLKPFNPLLGETFEFQYPEQGWRGIAEKVCALPHPIPDCQITKWRTKCAALLHCHSAHACRHGIPNVT